MFSRSTPGDPSRGGLPPQSEAAERREYLGYRSSGRRNLAISEADVGELFPTKHAQYRTTSNKPVLSMQDAPAWTDDCGSEYDVVGPED